MKIEKDGQRGHLAERALIVLGVVVYLLVFNRTLPHGDAMRIVRQIEASDLVWNPNHLLLDPFGYVFYRFVQSLGFNVTILNSFEIISAVSTIIALLLFNSVLLRLTESSFSTRVVATFGVFFSASFLSVALSQYFFMIQMPFLMGALHCYAVFIAKYNRGAAADQELYFMGFLLAIATGIMFNNLVLVGLCGFALLFSQQNLRQWTPWPAFKFFGASAAVGFPIFFIGFALSDSNDSFLTWLSSYEGGGNTELNEFYGLKFTVASVVESGARAVFKFALGSFVETAGMGGILRAMLFSRSLELAPKYGQIALALLCVPAVLIATSMAVRIVVNGVSRYPAIRLMGAWMAAYLIFNFLWNAGDEWFWFQIVPVIWLLLVTPDASAMFASAARWLRVPGSHAAIARLALPTLVALLATVNTLNAVVPVAGDRFVSNQRALDALLRSGDLLIMPGWDQQKWLAVGEGSVDSVQRVMLMNMALARSDSPGHIEHLPALIRTHLGTGGRVIVARLYDLDSDIMPWYSLEQLGWPRKRIQLLLGDYCVRRIAQIDEVVFRELTTCP